MHSSVDVGLRICTGQAAPNTSLVCCDVIAYLTTSSNIDIAHDTLATDVWETGIQRVV